MSLEQRPHPSGSRGMVAVLSLTEEDLDLLVRSEVLDVKFKKEVVSEAKTKNQPFLLYLLEEGLEELLTSGRLDAKLKDLSALKSHLDYCRANFLRVRVVDCSGRLGYKTCMAYSESAGVPSVGRLRSALTAHFEQVEASYREEVQEAINTLGSGLGTFSRSPLYFPGDPPFGPVSGDATRFVLDGISFSSMSFSRGPLVGEFFMSNHFIPNPQFLLRSANWDPSLRSGGRPRGADCCTESEDFFQVYRFHPQKFRSAEAGDYQSFSAFSKYVMGAVRDDSLELVLEPELFRDPARGDPCVATFSSLDVKKRFVELVEILQLARKIDIEEPGSQHLGLNIGSIVTRIMHKPEILRRLEEPHRTSFDNNDWWYLTRNCADLTFSLMAAESVDESQNKVLSDNHTSLADLVGAPEVLPDEDGEDERLIQLRITTRKAGH